MNVEGTDNRQLSLNIMHWLSGLIPVQPRVAAKKRGASRPAPSSRKVKSRPSVPKPVPDNQPQSVRVVVGSHRFISASASLNQDG